MHEFQLAAGLREEGNVAEALVHVERALEIDSTNPRAHLLLGLIYLGRAGHAEAETHVRRAIELLEARTDFRSVLAEARNVLGTILIHQRQYGEASTVLRQSATDPLNTAPFYAWGNLGWAYYENHQYDDSLDALRQAVRIQSRFCVGHYLMGQTLFAMERFEPAEDALTLALEADPRCEAYQEAWKLRGETRARLGQNTDAVDDFERCVELGGQTEAGRACQRFLDTVN